MRKILFRGKRVDNGEWVYGAYNNVCENTIIDVDDITHMRIDVIPETVGQYTGLTDSNGKKIFEGDVVLFRNGYKTLHYVYWQEETFSFILLPKNSVDNSKPLLESASKRIYEVIGNVHDNKELLEENK